MTLSPQNKTILDKADQCVKCGLCLPHCPTYRLFEDENESPRGRIALMQGLVSEQISTSPPLKQHLAHCLGCRSCEKICPSGVEYGFLLDQIRQRPDLQSNLKGLGLTTNRSAQRWLQSLLYLYQKSGLQLLLRSSGVLSLFRLQHLEKLLPEIRRYRELKTHSPTKGTSRGKVGLFVGCTGHLFDQKTLENTLSILQRLGFEVIIPPDQTCCGALHQHQGANETARNLAEQNIQAFTKLDTIIYIASGCGAQLHEYPTLHPDLPQAKAISKKTIEIMTFLSGQDLSVFQFAALNQKVLVHTPCSMRNGLRSPDKTQNVLTHIPEMTIEYLPADFGCCGAAGSYMINQPKLAASFRQPVLDAIQNQGADIVTSINVGCGLHINSGLPPSIHFTHPINLIAEQIRS